MFAVNYCCGNGKAFADRERIRIGGRNTARVCAEATDVRRRKRRKRRKLEEERRWEEEEKEEKHRLLKGGKEERRRIRN